MNAGPTHPARFTTVLRTELRKLRAGRGLLYTVGTGLALIALAAIGSARHATEAAMPAEEAALAVIRQGFAGLLFATITGSLLVTGEYRHRTWTRTYLVTPDRTRVLAAKAAASVAVGLPVGVLSALVSTAIAAGFGHAPVNTWEVWRLLLTIVLVSTLAGPWGVALGYLIRNQVATVLAVVAYTSGIEAVVIVALPDFGRFLPGGTQLSLLHDPELTAPLPGWAALALLLGYIAAALFGAVFRERTAEPN
ncbi:ABC transporter permease [Kitasatospora sp. NPDC059747]|uniref:ABC transporter permease n=1 Tax=Kitasatospora sp. NPDC059747 TaxID=3346930 RepID=UPI0036557D27